MARRARKHLKVKTGTKAILKGALRRRAGSKTDPRIVVWFSVITPESAAEGDYAETGLESSEEGYSVKPDRYDMAEGLTAVDNAVKFLRDEGASEASASHFHKGVWYTSHEEEDYRTGDVTTRSFHLKGFTEAQEREVFKRMTKRGR